MSASIRKIKNTKREINLKQILKDGRKKVRLYFLLAGVLLIGIGLYLSSFSDLPKEEVKETIAVESFSNEPVKIDSGLLSKNTNTKNKLPPTKILIPVLNIELPVKEAKVINGYWEVFPDSAGFGIGSSYPGEVGNQVIFAHARENLFLPLKKIKVGDGITVLTKDNWYQYKVAEVKEVLPTAVEVISKTSDETLTLYTCSGFADSKRLIVIAKKN